LKDADAEIETSLLASKFHDPEKGVGYWEIYDRRKRMERLSDFVAGQAVGLTPQAKVELPKQGFRRDGPLPQVGLQLF